MRGWLPASIDFDLRPAVLPDAPVRWVELGDAKLRATFLDDDLARLRSAKSPAREVETDVAALVRAGSRLPEVGPAGIIVDISRCGATVIGNALRGAAKTVVLSEPQPVASLLFPQGYAPGGWLRGHWAEFCDAVLPALLSLYAHYRTGDAERVILKLPSVNILELRAIRARWPETPCVVVVRDPVEVMLAHLKGGGWIDWKGAPERARDMLGWTEPVETVAAMSREEFCARAVARFLQSALDGIDEGCLLIDHEDINEARVRRIAAHFGLELPSGGVRRALDQLRCHDDREMKRRLASREVLDAAQRWAMRPYFDLRAR